MKQRIPSIYEFINEGNMFFVDKLKEGEDYVYSDFNNDLGEKEVNVKYIGELKNHRDIKLTFTRTYTIDIMKPTYVFQVLDDTKYYIDGKNMKDNYFAVTEAVVMRFIKNKS